MPKFSQFNDVLEEAKQRLLKHNLTAEEVSENTGVEPEFLRLLFDNTNNVSQDISKVLEFLKIRFTLRNLKFKVFEIREQGNQIKITRVIEPRCSIYYDKATNGFYKFKYTRPSIKRSKTITKSIQSEFKELIANYLSNDIDDTYAEIKTHK